MATQPERVNFCCFYCHKDQSIPLTQNCLARCRACFGLTALKLNETRPTNRRQSGRRVN